MHRLTHPLRGQARSHISERVRRAIRKRRPTLSQSKRWLSRTREMRTPLRFYPASLLGFLDFFDGFAFFFPTAWPSLAARRGGGVVGRVFVLDRPYTGPATSGTHQCPESPAPRCLGPSVT